MTNEQMKEWIDNASYFNLLAKWRNAPTGDLFFQGEIGDYYSRKMQGKRNANNDVHVQASKLIGWGKQTYNKGDFNEYSTSRRSYRY